MLFKASMFKFLSFFGCFLFLSSSLFSITNFVSEEERRLRRTIEFNRKSGFATTEIDYVHSNIFKNIREMKRLTETDFYKNLARKYLKDKNPPYDRVVEPTFFMDSSGVEYFRCSLLSLQSLDNYPKEVISKDSEVYIYFTKEKLTKIVILLQEKTLYGNESYFKTLKRFTHENPKIIDLLKFQGRQPGSNVGFKVDYFSGLDIDTDSGWRYLPDLKAKPSNTLSLSDKFLSYNQQTRILELYKGILKRSDLKIQNRLSEIKANFYGMFDKMVSY